jgi:hypothetical protein
MKILLSYGDHGAHTCCGGHFNWTYFLEPVILSRLDQPLAVLPRHHERDLWRRGDAIVAEVAGHLLHQVRLPLQVTPVLRKFDVAFQCDSKKRCGCDRAFTGISSRRGTTRAVVAETPVIRKELIDACVRSNDAAYPGIPSLSAWSRESAEKLIKLVQYQRVGTIVALKFVRHQPKLVRLGETDFTD